MSPAREPGSPSGAPRPRLLLLAEGHARPERFDDADALAVRVHALRAGRALDVTAGTCATAEAAFAGVLIWAVGRPTGAQAASRTYLAFAAGPGVDTPAGLLAALNRTRTPAATAA